MAPGRIKSFHGSHKAQITCLNKINHANLVTPSSKFILLDNTNNEPKVTIHYPDESTASPSLFDARDIVKVSPFSIHSPKLNPPPLHAAAECHHSPVDNHSSNQPWRPAKQLRPYSSIRIDFKIKSAHMLTKCRVAQPPTALN